MIKVLRKVTGFSKVDDSPVHSYYIRGVSIEALRGIFDPNGVDAGLFDIYPVDAEKAEIVRPYIDQELDLEHNNYYLDHEVIDTKQRKVIVGYERRAAKRFELFEMSNEECQEFKDYFDPGDEDFMFVQTYKVEPYHATLIKEFVNGTLEPEKYDYYLVNEESEE